MTRCDLLNHSLAGHFILVARTDKRPVLRKQTDRGGSDAICTAWFSIDQHLGLDLGLAVFGELGCHTGQNHHFALQCTQVFVELKARHGREGGRDRVGWLFTSSQGMG